MKKPEVCVLVLPSDSQERRGLITLKVRKFKIEKEPTFFCATCNRTKP